MARGYYPRIASLVAQEQSVVVLCEVVVVKFGGTDALSSCSKYGGIAAWMGRGALPASFARLRVSWGGCHREPGWLKRRDSPLRLLSSRFLSEKKPDLREGARGTRPDPAARTAYHRVGLGPTDEVRRLHYEMG